MKVVILCGGKGTRLSEETVLRPKPMVEIGGKPILWHILKLYEAQGFSEFVLALGYKSEFIKDYFLNYPSRNSDFTVDLSTGSVETIQTFPLNCKVHLIETGLETLTGGRLLRLKSFLNDAPFMFTYGDGVSNINLGNLLEFHQSHGKTATLTAVRPQARFGGLKIENDQITEFEEKPQGGEGWINGGFFVFNPEIFQYLENDQTILERKPMIELQKKGQLMAYRHSDFWQCMDTIRDRETLEELWNSSNPPWKLWKN